MTMLKSYLTKKKFNFATILIIICNYNNYCCFIGIVLKLFLYLIGEAAFADALGSGRSEDEAKRVVSGKHGETI